jgi:hypothetical protein
MVVDNATVTFVSDVCQFNWLHGSNRTRTYQAVDACGKCSYLLPNLHSDGLTQLLRQFLGPANVTLSGCNGSVPAPKYC